MSRLLKRLNLKQREHYEEVIKNRDIFSYISFEINSCVRFGIYLNNVVRYVHIMVDAKCLGC